MTTPRRALVAALLTGSLLLACTPADDAGTGTAPKQQQDQQQPRSQPEHPRFEVTPPSAQTAVLATSEPAPAALEVARALFAAAPFVVLGAAGEAVAHQRAEALGAPLLATEAEPATLLEEAQRLGAETALAVGAVPEQLVAELEEGGLPVVADEADLPETSAASGLSDVVVLTDGQPWSAAAAATARAAGASVHAVPEGDPRADSATVEALGAAPPAHVLALGDVFGPAETVRYRVEVASTGTQLPAGGQVLFPHRRLVALYGHPGASSLGVLGEQSVEGAVVRAKQVAAEYEPFSDVPVVPAFEIITTIASSEAGRDGDYSSEAEIAKIRPWVDAARQEGLYVLLDLQPGLTDFLTQARIYEELLREPHVGLALDPEWRLAPGQRHMRQIGSVTAQEVNETAAWLAALTREHRLPQKALVVHQFRLSMISGREDLETGYDELAIVLHADGHGTPGEKLETWDALRREAPDGVFWAWKNFYDEDRPTFTPQETMELVPSPLLVTYQ